ncbi:MAG: hypothetical protein GXP25_00015 [Planctomycetes bacterium]|nr:hypothetical protein [Planctomycetota bacterium]
MAIEVECPKCGAFLRLEEHLAGKQVECTECGNMMTVPKIETPPLTEAAPQGEEQVTFEERMSVEAAKIRRREGIPLLARHPGKVILAVVIVLLVLLGVNLPWLIQRVKVQAFIGLLETGNTPQRRAAAKELVKSGNATATMALIKFTKDRDLMVRRCCIQALGKIGDKRASGVLVELLEDPAEPVSADAAWSLASCGTPDAKPALQAVLDRPGGSGQLEAGARYALYKAGDTEQFDALITMLTTAEPTGRIWAARALGDIGNPEAIYHLERAASFNPAIVKDAFIKAINKIKEKKY